MLLFNKVVKIILKHRQVMNIYEADFKLQYIFIHVTCMYKFIE